MTDKVILVVDDNPNNVRLLKDILEDEDFKVWTAEDGRSVLALAQLHKPDAILLDIMMPGMDGFDTCEVLKADNETKDIPILMVTAKTNGSDLKKAFDLGAYDFIKKPIDEIEVIARVHSALRFKEREDRLKELASKDALTGVYNHALLIELFEKELAKQARDSGGIAFVMLDIDYFKKVNDQYGHPAGDQILKQLSALLISSVRTGDIIGRYGGEEFGIVLPGVDSEQAIQFCERIRSAVANYSFFTGKERIPITVSVGIRIEERAQAATCEEMIKHADEALYRAKHQGRNRVVLFQ